MKLRTLAALACFSAGLGFAGAQCPMEWATGYEARGVTGPICSVYAAVAFDDGTGPALYLGGRFQYAGASPANNLARWDGQRWSAVGAGLYPNVNALCVFDDGTGPALYAATNAAAAGAVYRWDGQRWKTVGDGLGYTTDVYALLPYDDGSGPALYAGIQRDPGVCRWTGQTWSAFGGGINGYTPSVRALASYDDGRGTKLFAGGCFEQAGSVFAENIACWDGATWSAVGGGLWDPFPIGVYVSALTVYDVGAGPALYAGGNFTRAGPGSGVATPLIARWDGAAWGPVGDGIVYVGGENNGVVSMTVFDDGSGPALFAGGEWHNGGSSFLARYDGTSWTTPGDGVDSYVEALAVHTPPGGTPGLYVAGRFQAAGSTGCARVVRWDGHQFSSLGTGLGLSDMSYGACYFDAGSGPELYVGGGFRSAGGVVSPGLVRWTESGWQPLSNAWGAGTMMVFNDGSGSALYASSSGVARWYGHGEWEQVGHFFSGVLALCAYDDGQGLALYAAGDFGEIGSLRVNNIAKWDGLQWSGLAGGLNRPVRGLAAFTDARGPALYVGGTFDRMAASPYSQLRHIARWDGHTWSEVGGGTSGNYGNYVGP